MKEKKQVSIEEKPKDRDGKGGKEQKTKKQGKDAKDQGGQSLLDIRNRSVSTWLNSINDMTKIDGAPSGTENPTKAYSEITDVPGKQKINWDSGSIASSVSERRYDDFAGVEKAKWMELLDLRMNRQKEKETNKDNFEDRASDRRDSFSKDFFKVS